MKRKKYLIVTTQYDERWGGVMVLHKLCDLLNHLGEKAYLCPMPDAYLPCSIFSEYVKETFKVLFNPKEIGRRVVRVIRAYKWMKTAPDWNTPTINPLKVLFGCGLNNYIVIYPEIVGGNPVGANNIVRWLLHNPGHHTHEIKYGTGELLVRYSDSFARDYKAIKGSVISKNFLTISVTPSFFSDNDCARTREGIAYCIRKGKGKQMVHDIADAILIDGKPLEEIAEIFKRVLVFVSYDSVTALSYFALLCRCPSVIILGNDETPETYRPEKDSYSHYAYNMNYEDIDWEANFKWAKGCEVNKETSNINNTRIFIEESQAFFNRYK